MVIFLLHIISPLLGLLLNSISQLFVCRYIAKCGLFKSVIVGFLCGLSGLFLIEVAYFTSRSVSTLEMVCQIVVNLIAYVGLAYCYFNFINLGETARRIRIVRELFESQNGLSIEDLLERYNASNIIDLRLQRMISKGQIVYRNDRYYIGKPLMLLIAKTIIMLKLLLLGKRTETE
ncbi:MAG: hypothetical protein MRK01_02390 [Candidatus Scalindua sp.]|nr:hypothetical protein [Candidatus Scalindua sp.]